MVTHVEHAAAARGAAAAVCGGPRSGGDAPRHTCARAWADASAVRGFVALRGGVRAPDPGLPSAAVPLYRRQWPAALSSEDAA